MHTDLLKSLRLDNSGVPIYVQLREQILRNLGAGVLARGDQMPTMREVAVALKIDLNTVRHAYDELERMGAITLVRGRGSFVAQPPPAMGVRAQAVQIDSLAKQTLATAAAAGIDPVALADRIKALAKEGIVVMSNYFKANGANRPAIVLAVVVLAFAAAVAWFAYDTSSRGGYILAVGLAIVAFLIPQAIMVADQWERAVVLRLGKLSAIRGPGLFVIVPFIDEVASWLDQRIQTTEINAEKALSKDTVPVNIDAIVFWQIHDPQRAALEIANYRQAITQVAQTSLREMVGSSLLSTLLSERKQGDQLLREEIGRKTAEWGVAVLSVEIRDIGVPPALQDAMSRQAQAERERLARVLLGQAEQEIAQKFVEAADIYARSPAALQLRAMNIIYETTKERGATILIPTAMVDAINPGGAMGIVAAARPLPA